MNEKDEHEKSCLISKIRLNSHEKGSDHIAGKFDYARNILKLSLKFSFPYSLKYPGIQYLICLLYSISWI